MLFSPYTLIQETRNGDDRADMKGRFNVTLVITAVMEDSEGSFKEFMVRLVLNKLLDGLTRTFLLQPPERPDPLAVVPSGALSNGELVFVSPVTPCIAPQGHTMSGEALHCVLADPIPIPVGFLYTSVTFDLKVCP
jgi:hypothetical protein